MGFRNDSAASGSNQLRTQAFTPQTVALPAAQGHAEIAANVKGTGKIQPTAIALSGKKKTLPDKH